MKMFATLAALGGVFILSLCSASAAVLSIVESADFSNNSPTESPLGTLGIGINTISGSVSRTCSPSITFGCGTTIGDDSSDRFMVDVAPGTEIISVLLTITDFSNPGSFIAFVTSIGTVGGSNSTLNSISSPTAFSDVDFLSGASSLEALLLNFTLSAGSGNDGLSSSFNYTATIEVGELAAAPVPVPGALALMLTGLGGLAWLKRRKRPDKLF